MRNILHFNKPNHSQWHCDSYLFSDEIVRKRSL